MKTELYKIIKQNYKDLSKEQISEITNKIIELLPSKKVIRLSEIETGMTFKYKGYEFQKLANEENSCYCLINATVFESKFGETNDWAKSEIRKRLNEFDKQGESLAIQGINKNDLIDASLNYYSYKNPNGRVKDKITILSWEEWCAYYYAYDFNISGYRTWLRSGYDNDANYAYVLYSSGAYDYKYDYDFTNNGYGVRPALHFRKDLEVEV